MKVQFIKLENDIIPKRGIKEPILFELKTGGYVLNCYNCGERAFLNHDVKIDGDKVTINPSLICPHCNAHYWIKDSEIQQA